ncbi:MAG TPA: hypothetical protein VGD08_22785 [Stellaceae bacterium]
MIGGDSGGGSRFAVASRRRNLIVTVVGLALLATALSACGRRAEPQPPDGAPITYPRPYPRA